MTIKWIKRLTPGIGENAWSFTQLSQIVWSEVDTTTWEIQDIFTSIHTNSPWRLITPWFSNNKNIIRATVWQWWEEQTKKLIPYARSTDTGSLYDIKKWDIKLEVKTTNLWNASVIKTMQVEKLKELPWDIYYSFVFYKIKWWIKPSSLPNNPTYIRRNLEVDSIFLFPIEYVVYLSNTLPKINTVHTPFTKVHRSWILELFDIAQEKWEKVIQNGNTYLVWDIIEFLKK